MPDLDTPTASVSAPCHDIRRSEETFPAHQSSNARETVRASVNERVDQLAARFERRQSGERSIFEPGERFAPTWGPEEIDDEEDDD